MHHLIRFLIGIIEFILRPTVFNKNLEEVEKIVRNISYGDHPNQIFDIIVPKGSNMNPILFYFHGGGWLTGDKSNFNWICHKFANSGMLVFNINYRLSPENQFPSQLNDVSNAIKSGMEYAKEYGGDLSNIYIAGDSAGAHLASLYITALGKPKLLKQMNVTPSISLKHVKGCLLFYGIYDLETAWNIKHKVIKVSLECFLGSRPDIETLKYASPSQHVGTELPPFFLCAGEPDVLFSQTKDFSETLKRAGIECKTVLFTKEKNPESNHSFINFGKRNCTQIATREAISFISKRGER
jgi:acetyl esterase/lipase